MRLVLSVVLWIMVTSLPVEGRSVAWCCSSGSPSSSDPHPQLQNEARRNFVIDGNTLPVFCNQQPIFWQKIKVQGHAIPLNFRDRRRIKRSAAMLTVGFNSVTVGFSQCSCSLVT